ncbi:MAG TPA: BrnT family toxin [Hyphomicrobiaceae bacterium]
MSIPLFEWNSAKARTNLARHGVDFEVAKDVFLDRAGLVDIDDSDPGEERWRIVGRAGGKLLFVVFTKPDDDVIRIISAREANKREERRYYGQTAP